MRGLNLSEQAKIVPLTPPQSYSGAAKNSAVFSLKNYSHATILVYLGATDADAGNLKLQECDDFVPSNTTDIPFFYYKEETAGGDTLSGRQELTQANAATGVDLAPAGVDNVLYAIEIDAADLTPGTDKLRVQLTTPGGAQLGTVMAILTGARYASDQSPTVLS